MPRRGEASKGKREAVRAVLKAFRAVLFGLLSPKRSTRETVMLTETPPAPASGVMGSINQKGPQGFQDGSSERRDGDMCLPSDLEDDQPALFLFIYSSHAELRCSPNIYSQASAGALHPREILTFCV